MHTRKVGSIAKVACYPCKHPVHLCAMTKVVVDGQGMCQRSDAMSCMVLYKLNNDLVMEMGGNRSFEDFREWMLGTTSCAGKTCVRVWFVFEKLISLKGQSNGSE